MKVVVRRVGGLAAGLAAGLTAALGVSAPALAAGEGQATIDHAELQHGALQLLVTVPGQTALGQAQVSVTVGGRAASATSHDASKTQDVTRTTVLAIDTSDSMKGARIAAAKQAALSYLSSVPANVQVGIVTFDATVDEAVAPTLDRTSARAAIKGLRLGNHTDLYAGVAKAVEATGTQGQREVLLLSDGKDTTRTPLSAAVAGVRQSGVTLDAVSLQPADADDAPLNRLASAGGGSMIDATAPHALAAAYAGEAHHLARQLLVTVHVPAGQRSKDATTAVTISSGGQTYEASAYITVRGAAPKATPAPADEAPLPVATSPLSLTRPIAMGATVAIGLGLIGLALVFVRAAHPDRRARVSISEQIGTYGLTGTGAREAEHKASVTLADHARTLAQRALANNRTLEARIAQRLEAAGAALRPAEWLLVHAGILIGVGVVGALLGAGNPVLILVALGTGAVGPWVYLGLRRTRRLRAFAASIADTLQLLSGSLSAGLSLAQALDTVVREGTEPIAGEFRRVIVETRLGVNLDDALQGVADRMESVDFAWVVMAIRIQREVGGNLAELLNTVAATLRERDFLRRHVRALSAEGRLSCYILCGLPPIFALYLMLTKPSYMQPMYTTGFGVLMCVGGVVLLSVGMFWMSRVVKVEL